VVRRGEGSRRSFQQIVEEDLFQPLATGGCETNDLSAEIAGEISRPLRRPGLAQHAGNVAHASVARVFPWSAAN